MKGPIHVWLHGPQEQISTLHIVGLPNAYHSDLCKVQIWRKCVLSNDSHPYTMFGGGWAALAGRLNRLEFYDALPNWEIEAPAQEVTDVIRKHVPNGVWQPKRYVMQDVVHNDRWRMTFDENKQVADDHPECEAVVDVDNNSANGFARRTSRFCGQLVSLAYGGLRCMPSSSPFSSISSDMLSTCSVWVETMLSQGGKLESRFPLVLWAIFVSALV